MNKLKGYHTKGVIEAGCDEAGRGCLAGPVVAAAVILPANFKHSLLNDSKQMSDKQRKELRPYIEENAIAWAVGIVSPQEIDEINILNASFLAMHRALDQLKVKFSEILVDGNRFKKYHDYIHHCIIKGDGKYKSIAAASVLAKTYRDDIMDDLHLQFPDYAWEKNKGYPTVAHRTAIKEKGTTPHHRMSFTLLPEQLKLQFD
jgi:ribonuclease HII